MNIRLFDFPLPEELIATYPSKEREDSRLLVSLSHDKIIDSTMITFPTWIRSNDLVIFNDTKVWKARLQGQRSSGGALTLLIIKIESKFEVNALVQSSKSLKTGENFDIFAFSDQSKKVIAQVIRRTDDGQYCIQIKHVNDSIEEWLDCFGEIPIPPYLKRKTCAMDLIRYQTTFGKYQGSVAASTAGLHFGKNLMQKLVEEKIETAFITLHIGLGTFQPIRTENIANHKMHEEHYVVSEKTIEAIRKCKKNHGRVIAVGTTVLRALESFALDGHKGETSIFIQPGFKFQIVDVLLTNFHLPKSSLLVLIAAFVGMERFQRLYQHALQQNYRFLSYGDAMLIAKA